VTAPFHRVMCRGPGVCVRARTARVCECVHVGVCVCPCGCVCVHMMKRASVCPCACACACMRVMKRARVCVRVHLSLPEPGLQGISGALGVVVGTETLLGHLHPRQGSLKALPELLLLLLGHVTCLTKRATIVQTERGSFSISTSTATTRGKRGFRAQSLHFLFW